MKRRSHAARTAAAIPRPVRLHLPRELELATSKTLAEWQAADGLRRIHERDAALWTRSDEPSWLGWLEAPFHEKANLPRLRALEDEVRDRGLTRAVLLGMGGASLWPDVLSRSFPVATGHAALTVLDSTDPAEIAAVVDRLVPEKTLFIVSSKSGTTLETDLLEAFFHELMEERLGSLPAASRFVAVTDAGSPLARRARLRGYAHTFHTVPGIDGRYAALTSPGTVPAAVMGVDVELLLERAAVMVGASTKSTPPGDCPGVVLGTALGAAAKAGRDKVTIVASPPMAALGAWIEQLLAESTGKRATGLLPVDREPLGRAEVYGSDRIFVYLRLDRGFDRGQDAAVAELEAAGQPTVRIALTDAYDLGQEVYRWELATAVAASILGVNPFDQPDVEASKTAARQRMEAYDQAGELPDDAPFFADAGLALYADPANREALERGAAGDRTLRGYLRAHFARLSPGDYAALLAWVDRSEAHERLLEEMRRAVRDHRHVATCVEFGPRYLHSTGQMYKGGPGTGEYLQITADEPEDLPIPGYTFTFGIVEQAQALGDFATLSSRGRRALRVHLGREVDRGLNTLARAVHEALAA
ncbi:bifunctional transaldolase/phosoglucose isomerase [Sorangium sp. So ce375]|uniref:bifunctional transaldolase/phosoglucose isomerase n=1 Tax=Sorangium sp. So ce375 TaxID=3133306 RepID=UPI003F5BD653